MPAKSNTTPQKEAFAWAKAMETIMNKIKRKRFLRSASIFVILLSLASAQLPLAASSTTDNNYDGKNMIIAVLDSGFFTSHECFTVSDSTIGLTKDVSDSLIKFTSVGKDSDMPETLYISEKIPFAYDYGDGDSNPFSETASAHGTAMISIAAGNPRSASVDNPSARGIAPEAQILAMKVYSDKTGSVSQTALVRAVEDSIVLGADVILLPISSICGIESEPESKLIAAAIEKAEASGIPVICPVGNVLEYGKESFYELEYDFNPLPTASVDIGTVAWPGTLPNVITVASAIDNKRTAYTFELPSDTIPFSDSNYLYPHITNGKLFSNFFFGKSLEYVYINGIGVPEDFSSVGNISGKIAIVHRGTISFSEKTVNAAAAGAIGVIVVDNQPYEQVTFETKTDLSGAVLPLILVPQKTRNAFLLEDEKVITVTKTSTYTVTTRDTPYPSPFSAAGTTPELSLKPDITAIGSAVGCATPDGGYATISSTSAAAAKIAGMYVCVKEKLISEYSEYDSAALAEKAKAILINSSKIMTLPADSLSYSPRYQGAGCADLEHALSSELLIHSSGKYKIELGEMDSRFVSFNLTAQNISDTEKRCSLDAIISSDGYTTHTVEYIDAEPGDIPLAELLSLENDDTISFISGSRELSDTNIRIGDGFYQLNRAAHDYEPFTFTLAPHSTLTFKVSIALGADEYKAYCEAFENGFFIEGFMRLTSDTAQASIPFIGFVGDFSKAPALDSSLYDGVAPLFEGIYLYTSDSENGSSNILGEELTNNDGYIVSYDKNKIFFNPTDTAMSSGVMLNFGLLRTVTDVTVTVYDPEGKTIKCTEYGTLARTHMSATSGMLESPKLSVFSGRAEDNYKYIYPDGVYTVTVSYRKPSSPVSQRFSYDIHLDTTAPLVTDYSFNISEYKCILNIKAEDNMALKNIFVIDSNMDAARLTADGGFDTSLLAGQYIYIDVLDFAGNRTTLRLDNPVYLSDDADPSLSRSTENTIDNPTGSSISPTNPNSLVPTNMAISVHTG